MSMQINNSVTNVYKIPGMYFNIDSNAPAANAVPPGFIVVDPYVPGIYISDGTNYIQVGGSGGGGGVGTIDQVLSTGDTALNKNQYFTDGGNNQLTLNSTQTLIQDFVTLFLQTLTTSNGYEVTQPGYSTSRCFFGFDLTENDFVNILENTNYKFVNYGLSQYVFDKLSGKYCGINFQNLNNQVSVFPNQGGTLTSLNYEDPIYIDLNTASFLIDPGLYSNSQNYFIIDGGTGSNNLELKSSTNNEIILLIRTTPVSIVTNSAFTMNLYGNPNINTPGYYKAFFNRLNPTTYEVYLSHT